jgi:predicted DCC family thiol-disulfide oxidoreductase YuxK
MDSFDSPILLYDGTCHFCNKTVSLILRFEKAPVLMFAMIQSHLGEEIIGKAEARWKTKIDSIVLVDKKQIWIKSNAAIHVAKYLKFPFSLARFLTFVPLSFRDYMYSWIAKNRYGWFGKSETCIVPDASIRSRFIL